MPHTGMDMDIKSLSEAIGGPAGWRAARSFRVLDSLIFPKLSEQVECLEL